MCSMQYSNLTRNLCNNQILQDILWKIYAIIKFYRTFILQYFMKNAYIEKTRAKNIEEAKNFVRMTAIPLANTLFTNVMEYTNRSSSVFPSVSLIISMIPFIAISPIRKWMHKFLQCAEQNRISFCVSQFIAIGLTSVFRSQDNIYDGAFLWK